MFGTVLALPRRLKWMIGVYLLVGISESFSWRWSYAIFQRIIDAVPGSHGFAGIAPLFWTYAAIKAGQYVLIYLEVWPGAILSTGVFQWAKLNAMRKVARIDYLAWQKLGTGGLVQTIENGADASRGVVLGFWVHLLRSIIPEIGISLYMLWIYDHRAALWVAAVMPLAYPISWALFRYAERSKGKLLDRQEEFSRRAVRAFMEMVTFRVHSRFGPEIARGETVSDDIVRTQGRMKLIQESGYQAFACFVLLVELGVIWSQVVKIAAGTSTVGTMVAMSAFCGGALWPIHDFHQAYIDWKLNLVALGRFEGFLKLPDDANTGRTEALRPGRGEITLDAVSFGYEGRPVLKELTLTMAGGQMTALAGETGSGKSTIVKLAMGLLKPSRGCVRVDGQDLGGVDLGTFYGRIAYLPQEAAVFDGTIRENLVFDRPVADGELFGALDRVKLGDVVRKLPRGLDSEIGERGVTLSGGERQRLAIARAFLQAPAIVIMDEPTSSLDSLTEEFVTDHMRELFAEKTVIVIAHRLQTVRGADRIVVVERGNVVQQGTFDALVSAPGRFRELWEVQTRRAGMEPDGSAR